MAELKPEFESFERRSTSSLVCKPLEEQQWLQAHDLDSVLLARVCRLCRSFQQTIGA
jgi:hypothetical protein